MFILIYLRNLCFISIFCIVTKFIIAIRMEFVSCNNFRISGDTITKLNIEEFIKSIESQYNVDMTSPKWRFLITRIQAAVIDYRRRVKDHKLRNSLILEKLTKEFTYISPFYLTDVMARTARKWELLKTPRVIKLNPILPENIGSVSSRSINTEIKEEETPEITIDDDKKEKVDTFLPPLNTTSSKTINNNISLIGSEIYKELIKDIMTTEKTKNIDSPVYTPSRHILLNTSTIKHSPKIIKIGSSQEQSLVLKLKNCGNHIAFIQYQSQIDISNFKCISVLPATTVKLVPGITYSFKLFFKLVNQQEFSSKITFHVKYPSNSTTLPKPYDEYYIPIISLLDKKLQYRSVTAPKIIEIPPIYSWQVNNKFEFYEYPFGSTHVSIDTNDNHSYYVRIVKRDVDIASDDADETNASNEVNITSPTSVLKYIDDEFKDSSLSKVLGSSSVPLKGRVKSTSVSSRRAKSLTSNKSSANIITTMNSNIRNEVLQLIVEVVERAMSVFVFDKTYLFLKSGQTKFVRVYFIQVQHIGCHNCYYDFKFYDSKSNELIFTKTTRVFADVMPHPIQITPDALDMTDTPIIHGKCVNSFVITNTHSVYPVNIRLVTSAKMKKLIKIEPIKMVILQKKSAKFLVSLCTSNRIDKLDEEDLVDDDNLFVLFTFKIVISGSATAYKHITPIYYDIVAPGVHEYERVYHGNTLMQRQMKKK